VCIFSKTKTARQSHCLSENHEGELQLGGSKEDLGAGTLTDGFLTVVHLVLMPVRVSAYSCPAQTLGHYNPDCLVVFPHVWFFGWADYYDFS